MMPGSIAQSRRLAAGGRFIMNRASGPGASHAQTSGSVPPPPMVPVRVTMGPASGYPQASSPSPSQAGPPAGPTRPAQAQAQAQAGPECQRQPVQVGPGYPASWSPGYYAHGGPAPVRASPQAEPELDVAAAGYGSHGLVNFKLPGYLMSESPGQAPGDPCQWQPEPTSASASAYV